MKTISVQTLMPAQFGNAQGLVEAATKVVRDQRRPIRGSIPSWLPVPSPRLSPAVKCAARSSAKAACSPWLPLESEGMMEKLMWGLLVLAAVIGITHGFSFLVDWVQNWAGFTAATGKFIQ